MSDILSYLPVLDRIKNSQDLSVQQAIAGKADPTIINANDVQTINAQKTFANAPVRVLDGTGTLIHAFGTKT